MTDFEVVFKAFVETRNELEGERRTRMSLQAACASEPLIPGVFVPASLIRGVARCHENEAVRNALRWALGDSVEDAGVSRALFALNALGAPPATTYQGNPCSPSFEYQRTDPRGLLYVRRDGKGEIVAATYGDGTAVPAEDLHGGT